MRTESGLDLQLTLTSTDPLKGDLVVRCTTEDLSEDKQLFFTLTAMRPLCRTGI